MCYKTQNSHRKEDLKGRVSDTKYRMHSLCNAGWPSGDAAEGKEEKSYIIINCRLGLLSSKAGVQAHPALDMEGNEMFLCGYPGLGGLSSGAGLCWAKLLLCFKWELCLKYSAGCELLEWICVVLCPAADPQPVMLERGWQPPKCLKEHQQGTGQSDVFPFWLMPVSL